MLGLVAVVLLAKALAPTIEAAVAGAGAPKAVVGIIIAMVVLLPEGLAAYRAARANRLQTSLNLALGSALASIGLTIPAVAIVSLATGWTLTLGLDIKSSVLLLLSLFVSSAVAQHRAHHRAPGRGAPGAAGHLFVHHHRALGHNSHSPTMDQFRQMQAFVAVVQAGSFVQAAAAAGYLQGRGLAPGAGAGSDPQHAPAQPHHTPSLAHRCRQRLRGALPPDSGRRATTPTPPPVLGPAGSADGSRSMHP